VGGGGHAVGGDRHYRDQPSSGGASNGSSRSRAACRRRCARRRADPLVGSGRRTCAWRSMFTNASASPWVDHHRVGPRRARAAELALVDALDRETGTSRGTARRLSLRAPRRAGPEITSPRSGVPAHSVGRAPKSPHRDRGGVSTHCREGPEITLTEMGGIVPYLPRARLAPVDALDSDGGLWRSRDRFPLCSR
jgi:hypothetical protein